MRKSVILLAIFIIAIVGGAAAVFWATDYDFSWSGKQAGSDLTEKDVRTERVEVPTGKKRYAHPALGFSLIIPEDMETDTYRKRGETARTVTFAMLDPKEGQFQVYIVPYKNEKITSSQISKDTHGRAIGEPEEILLNDDLHALTFLTEDPLLGSLREVWLLNNGYLYEVTASVDLDSWLLEIMQTWNFTR